MPQNYSVLPAARQSGPQGQPFPHIVLPQALSDELVRKIEAAFPGAEKIIYGRTVSSNEAVRMDAKRVMADSSFPAEIHDFFRYHTSQPFWQDIIAVFGETIRRQHPQLEAKVGRRLEDWRVGVRGTSGCDAHMDCLWVINTPVTNQSRVKYHHIDFADKIFSGLYYLREPDDETPGGELELYRWRRQPRFLRYRALDRDIKFERNVPYERNLFCGFVNSVDAVHGVSPRPATNRLRRYINFIVELPFDVFPVPQVNPITRALNKMKHRKVRGEHKEQVLAY